MKTKIMFSITTALMLATTILTADSIKPTELKMIKNADVPIHSFYGFDNAHYKVSKKELAYYNSLGLLPEHQIINKAVKKQGQKLTQSPMEILQALDLTDEAMASLEKDKTKSATIALKAASKLFDKALKNNQKLKFVPVDVSLSVLEHGITLTEAQKIKQKSLKLLENDQTQDAIDLLLLLRNQLTIDTAYLPMELYPIATKTALKALHQNKGAKVALKILLRGVDTIVHTKMTVPISLLISQEAITTAQELSKSRKDKETKLIQLAKEQLQLAHIEGYLPTSSNASKTLMSEIDKLITKSKKGNVQKTDYEKSKTAYATLIDSVAKEEATALAKPKMTEGNPRAKAKVEETGSKERFETKLDKENFKKEVEKDLKDTVK